MVQRYKGVESFEGMMKSADEKKTKPSKPTALSQDRVSEVFEDSDVKSWWEVMFCCS